jgi:hypothetical protein
MGNLCGCENRLDLLALFKLSSLAIQGELSPYQIDLFQRFFGVGSCKNCWPSDPQGKPLVDILPVYDHTTPLFTKGGFTSITTDAVNSLRLLICAINRLHTANLTNAIVLSSSYDGEVIFVDSQQRLPSQLRSFIFIESLAGKTPTRKCIIKGFKCTKVGILEANHVGYFEHPDSETSFYWLWEPSLNAEGRARSGKLEICGNMPPVFRNNLTPEIVVHV